MCDILCDATYATWSFALLFSHNIRAAMLLLVWIPTWLVGKFLFFLILVVLRSTDSGSSTQRLFPRGGWSPLKIGSMDTLSIDDASSAFALCRYICAAYVAVACIRKPCWHGSERSWYPSRGTPCKAHVVRYLSLVKCQGKSDRSWARQAPRTSSAIALCRHICAGCV
jgi:hypothetical protein